MDKLYQAISRMIQISDEEFIEFSDRCHSKDFRRQEILSKPGITPDQIFFIIEGLLRVIVADKEGIEHSIHFALENQFIADYSAFIQQQPSMYSIQAIEDTRAIILPRKTIEWGYENLAEGQKLGRLIAEYYFIYQDNRIKNLYARSPKERYDSITDVFPNIHNRVPQHMIASYLGMTSVHLSRLKNKSYKKV